jgi:hypothetical protein
LPEIVSAVEQPIAELVQVHADIPIRCWPLREVVRRGFQRLGRAGIKIGRCAGVQRQRSDRIPGRLIPAVDFVHRLPATPASLLQPDCGQRNAHAHHEKHARRPVPILTPNRVAVYRRVGGETNVAPEGKDLAGRLTSRHALTDQTTGGRIADLAARVPFSIISAIWKH